MSTRASKDADRAARIFEDFHARDAKKFGELGCEVPQSMRLLGACRWVTYRSDKWNDGTHDYIHKIESFPRVRVAVPGRGGDRVSMPAKVRETQVLTQIGLSALGFAYGDDGDETEASLPRGAQWFWSERGRALLAIQSKKKLLAVVWGGALQIEPRGIVG